MSLLKSENIACSGRERCIVPGTKLTHTILVIAASAEEPPPRHRVRRPMVGRQGDQLFRKRMAVPVPRTRHAGGVLAARRLHRGQQQSLRKSNSAIRDVKTCVAVCRHGAQPRRFRRALQSDRDRQGGRARTHHVPAPHLRKAAAGDHTRRRRSAAALGQRETDAIASLCGPAEVAERREGSS
jgi:hypothetical protein